MFAGVGGGQLSSAGGTMRPMRTTLVHLGLVWAAALIALTGAGSACAAPAAQAQQVIAQFADPDAPARRGTAARAAVRPPIALPAAAAASAGAGDDDREPRVGPLLLALLGLVLLLAARTRRRED